MEVPVGLDAAIHMFFLVVAVALFLLAAIPAASARVNLVAIGLAALAIAFLVE